MCLEIINLYWPWAIIDISLDDIFQNTNLAPPPSPAFLKVVLK